MTKVCSVCYVEKPLIKFTKNGVGSNKCKECAKAQKKSKNGPVKYCELHNKLKLSYDNAMTIAKINKLVPNNVLRFQKGYLYENWTCETCSFKNDVSLDNIRAGKSCPQCFTFKTPIDELHKEFAELYPRLTIYNIEYRPSGNNSKAFMTYKCNTCGVEKDKECSQVRFGVVCSCKTIQKNINKYTKELANKHTNCDNIIVYYDKNITNNRKYRVKYTCKKCNTEYDKSLVLARTRGSCSKCSLKIRTIEERLVTIKKKHGHIFTILNLVPNQPKTTPSHTKAICQCNQCGTIASAQLGTLEKRQSSIEGGSQAFKCKCYCNSIGEYNIKQYLDNNNITYITEHTFDDLKHENHLRLDFYLPDLNVALEANGPHHYNKDHKWHNESTFIRDKIKKQYLLEHNIPLIEIPYWEYDKIDKVLPLYLAPYL